MSEYLNKLLADLHRSLEDQKRTILEAELTRKGFAHYIPQISKALFPKVMGIEINGWIYFFAEDYKPDRYPPVFIVAFEINPRTELSNNPTDFNLKIGANYVIDIDEKLYNDLISLQNPIL